MVSWIRFLLTILILFGVLPFAAWYAVDHWFGNGSLVGPYLYVSPMIALTSLSMVLRGHFRSDRKNASVSDPALEAMANQYAAQLGLANQTVLLQPEDSIERQHPIWICGDLVNVFSEPWRKLSDDEKQFAMAQSLSALKIQLIESRRWRPLIMVAFFASCMAAASNLWSILVLHTGTLLALYYYVQMREFRRTLAADAKALVMTENPDAARRFILKTAPRVEFPEGITELRLRRMDSYNGPLDP